MRRWVLVALALPALCARADGRDDAALRIADEAPQAVATASDWRGFAEAAFGVARRGDGGGRVRHRRLSLDLRVDHAFSAPWRVVFADRLDASWPPQGTSDDSAINTVKEAYFSRQFGDNIALDTGRVNARYGAAMGYNPTDHFRADSVRSVASIDPQSLRENRQGSVMLRAQKLWDDGALTLVLSPRLGTPGRADGGFDLDWVATNPRPRALLAWSPRLAQAVNPQFLLYREEGMPPQFGLDVSALLGHAAVATVEWSGGRGPSLLSQALGQTGPVSWHNRAAGGLTYTAPNKLSLTAEVHYNGAALDREAWRALSAGPPALYALYRQEALSAQDPPTRRSLFFHASWPDAPMPRVDLGAMLNVDLADSSRRLWLQVGYRGERLDFSVQCKRTHGQPLSTWGAVPESTRWELSVRGYF